MNTRQERREDAEHKWQVFPDGAWENDQGPDGWAAVADDDGILAYFRDEETACDWRTAQIEKEVTMKANN